ncbi:hypothetical protein MTO96_006567 [Rhipicephalus appendiculatus]
MFALVRFINEIDKTKRYVIPVEDIQEFEPLHVLDFDNKLTYSAYWSDPNVEENSGEYVVQILKLAVQQSVDNIMSQPCRCGKGAIQQRSAAATFPKATSELAVEAARCHENPHGDSVRVTMPAASTPQDVPSDSDWTEQAVEEAVSSDQPAQQKAEFSPCDGGLFHLSNNIYITEEQAAKLFKNKKPTILVRDAAQVVWGCDTLAQRSVSGRLCPTKTNSGQEPSKQLTPEKVEVVYGCLAHWGQVNKTDTTLARSNVMRTLCEKIQDCKKKLRMK